jgi:hypothetical protein
VVLTFHVLIDGEQRGADDEGAWAPAWYRNDETPTLAWMISNNSKSFSGDLKIKQGLGI